MKEKENIQATDSAAQIEFAGRKFDPTPEGLEQLKTYGEELSKLVGRQSNEVGQARKQLKQYQRIVSDLPEPVRLVLESDEASQEAKLLAQYIAQEKTKSLESEEASYRNKWYADATELVLEELPELKDTYDQDMIRSFLKEHAIHSSEDPLGEAKRLLSGKVKKKAAPSQSTDDHVSVGASSPRAQGARDKVETPKVDNYEDYLKKALGIE